MRILNKFISSIFYALILSLFVLSSSAFAESFDWNKHRIEQEYLTLARSVVRNYLSAETRSNRDKFEIKVSIVTAQDDIGHSFKNKSLTFLPSPKVAVTDSGIVELKKIKFNLFLFDPMTNQKAIQVQNILKKYFNESKVEVSVDYQIAKPKEVVNISDLAEKKKIVIYNQLYKGLKEYFTGEVRFDLFVNVNKEKGLDHAAVELFTYKKVEKEVEKNVAKIVTTYFPTVKFDFSFTTLLSPVELENARLSREAALKQERLKKLEVLKTKEKAEEYERITSYGLTILGIVFFFGVLVLPRFSYKLFFKSLKDKLVRMYQERFDKAHLQKVQKSLQKDYHLTSLKVDPKTVIKKADSFYGYDDLLDELEYHLHQHRELVAKNISNSYEDLKGIKTLLKFSPKNGENMKSLLSMDAAASLFELKATYDENNFKDWLKHLLSKFKTVSIKDHTFYQKVLGPELWGNIESVPYSILINSAIKVKSVPVFKVLVNYLPTKEATKLMDKFDEQDWSNFLNEEPLNKIQLFKDMTQLLEHSTNELQIHLSENDHREKVLPLLESIINRKDQDQVRIFIDNVTQSNKFLGEQLKANYWSEQNLDDIPEHYLTKKMKDYEANHLALIFFGMSTKTRERMFLNLGLFEKNNIQKALEELNALNDSSLRNAGQTALRGFVKDLKSDYVKGYFSLKTSVEKELSAAA